MGWILLVTSAGGMDITQGSVQVVKEKVKERKGMQKEKAKDGKKARVVTQKDGAKEKDQE